MVYKKLFFYSVFFFFYFSSNFSYSHAVYVSVCNIYQKNERSFFSMRAFKDDIFDALGFVGYSSDLTEKQKTAIINYIKTNFIVSVDGRKKNLLLDRFIFEGSDYTETANVVFTIEETLGEKNLSIKNTILFDVLEEQTNIVGVKINNTKKTLTFNKNKKESWVQIN
ncbi:MAG: hypothetical protein CMB90_02975 [Flammeovirgaceae bacterium]|nr:hypothetical protein [Flammeovirgaceae bacterium]|tara:strand:+ start:350 stop:850 length:501 start_codon:yes stop_codon:yes gene_type:complete